MQQPDCRTHHIRQRRSMHALMAAAALALASSAFAQTAPLRWSAPLTVSRPAPFVQLELTPAAYAHIEQASLGDLRVVDSAGERAPFAFLAPRAGIAASEQLREAVLYPLPARPAPGGNWTLPVDVVVQGDRIEVRRHGGAPATTAAAGARESGGWLLDLGPARSGDAPARSLRLRWSGPAEFSSAYQIESSDDLREWRSGGAGQLMALQSPAGALVQDVVPLPEGTGRFVRLVWAEAAQAPAVTGASVVARAPQLVALDAASELAFSASPEPAGRTPPDEASRRALHFDLGAALPLVDVELRFARGTHVAPVRLQGRSRADEAWRELGAGVFYRLERAGSVGESPAIAVPSTVRFVRVVPDERAATIAAADVRLLVHARLASIVFAAQGQPPYRLLAGSRDAPAGALPASTVVPALDDERPRFGLATLGPFTEVPAAAQALASEARSAQWRPWLLWGVLLLGVAGLGALVFRLARNGPAPPPA